MLTKLLSTKKFMHSLDLVNVRILQDISGSFGTTVFLVPGDLRNLSQGGELLKCIEFYVNGLT